VALGIILCGIGLTVLGFASDRLVVNSGHLATRFNIPPVIIGAVVVGFGTSAPELVVSSLAAVNGDPDLGVGNIIGSNVANVTLVLGVAALITPVRVRKAQLFKELPMCLASVAVFALLVQNGLSRVEGLILIGCLVAGLVILYTRDGLKVLKSEAARVEPGRPSGEATLAEPEAGPVMPDAIPAVSEAGIIAPEAGIIASESGIITPEADPVTPESGTITPEADPAEVDERSAWRQVWNHGFGAKKGRFLAQGLWLDIIWLAIGLGGTVGGAQLLVTGAQRIAEELDLGSGFIGLTVVAVGTSLPELVTASAASRRGMNELLVGNVLGSNIFNALAGGGLVGLLGNSGTVDSNLAGTATFIMLGVMVWTAIAATTRRKISRWESALLLAGWFASLPFIIS